MRVRPSGGSHSRGPRSTRPPRAEDDPHARPARRRVPLLPSGTVLGFSAVASHSERRRVALLNESSSERRLSLPWASFDATASRRGRSTCSTRAAASPAAALRYRPRLLGGRVSLGTPPRGPAE